MSYGQAVQTRIDKQWRGERVGAHGVPLFGTAMRKLRDRARNLERESVLAFATLDRTVENVVSTGIRVRPTSGDKKFNRAIKKLWDRWIRGKNADARRLLTWSQLQQLIYRGTLRDGDVGVLLIDDGTGPTVQLIDANSIATPPNRPDRSIRDGVELDAGGRAVAYWIRTVDANAIVRFTRVESRDLIFFHRSPRHDVVRGESAFNGTFRVFENLEGYFEAVVVAARIGASAAMIRRRKRPAGNPLGRGEKDEGPRQPRQIPIQPGMINEIDADDELVAFNPAQPTQNFADATRTFSRVAGLKFGLTVQRVLLDFSQTNYSVSRSTALQEQRFAEPEQLNFFESVLRRIYNWFVSKMVKAGRVVDDKGRAIAEPKDSWECEWIPPARPLVEPAKDAPGLAQLIRMNAESFDNVAEGFGYDLAQNMKDNARAYRRMKKLGLPFGDEPPALPDEEADEEFVDPDDEESRPAPNVARRRGGRMRPAEKPAARRRAARKPAAAKRPKKSPAPKNVRRRLSRLV
jgi:lambda family phage portal protein